MQDIPRGADPVNDELEVGFDQRFERGWALAERIGRLLMIAFVAAALGGFLGRGPFSHRTTSQPGSSLSVDYEPVARVQTATQITFHIDNDTAASTARLFIDTRLVEPMGLQRILPQPLAEQTAGGGLVLTLAVPAGTRDAHVRLIVQPAGIGIVHLSAHLQDRPALHWTQIIVP
jgi:hypothetical protein